jgi:hypothetical protein
MLDMRKKREKIASKRKFDITDKVNKAPKK